MKPFMVFPSLGKGLGKLSAVSWGASQGRGGKNHPANAGDSRYVSSIPGAEDPLE